MDRRPTVELCCIRKQLLKRRRQDSQVVASHAEQAVETAQGAMIGVHQGIKPPGNRGQVRQHEILDVMFAEAPELLP